MDGLDLQGLPVLDPGTMARLRPLEADSPGMFGRLGTLFAAEGRAHLSALSRLVSQDDAAGVWTIVHRLKGTALTIGALRVAEVSGRIEVRSRRGEARTLGPLVEALEGELAAVVTAWVS